MGPRTTAARSSFVAGHSVNIYNERTPGCRREGLKLGVPTGALRRHAGGYAVGPSRRGRNGGAGYGRLPLPIRHAASPPAPTICPLRTTVSTVV